MANLLPGRVPLVEDTAERHEREARAISFENRRIDASPDFMVTYSVTESGRVLLVPAKVVMLFRSDW